MIKIMSPNDLGKKYLVEDTQQVNISTLLKLFKKQIKEQSVISSVRMQGIPTRLLTSGTGFGGIRYWFECPLCKRRKGVLYIHPQTHIVGCRTCLSLEYKKRRFKGMLEAKLA